MSTASNKSYLGSPMVINITGVEYQYFGSGAGVGELSNFAACEHFAFNGMMWSTSEACYQATYKFAPADWHRFAVGGDLSTLDGLHVVQDNYRKAFAAMTPGVVSLPHSNPLKQTLLDKLAKETGSVANSMKHWGKKKSGRPSMPGIVAKMASKRERAAAIGLTMVTDSELDEDALSDIFRPILRAKFKHNPVHTAALLATGDKLLIEFDRGAERETAKGRPPLWTGLVKDDVLYGRNLMGRLLAEVRERAQKGTL